MTGENLAHEVHLARCNGDYRSDVVAIARLVVAVAFGVHINHHRGVDADFAFGESAGYEKSLNGSIGAIDF